MPTLSPLAGAGRVAALVRSARALPSDLRAARRPPVFVIGLPRSGTTWVASTLARAEGVRYLHEPFNATHIPAARPFYMRYLRAADPAPAFERYSRAAFAGRADYNGHHGAKADHALQRRWWWPSRALVKDVHACLALDWISHHIGPQIVIVLRHPCATAASWARLRERAPTDWNWRSMDPHLGTLLSQPALLDDHLAPFQEVLESAETYFEKLGAFWGASNYVMLRQQEQHPEWLVVQHEALCLEPEEAFRELFGILGLEWSREAQQRLEHDTTATSNRPYVLKRVSKEEPDKWRTELNQAEADEVLRFARPFGLPVSID